MLIVLSLNSIQITSVNSFEGGHDLRARRVCSITHNTIAFYEGSWGIFPQSIWQGIIQWILSENVCIMSTSRESRKYVQVSHIICAHSLQWKSTCLLESTIYLCKIVIFLTRSCTKGYALLVQRYKCVMIPVNEWNDTVSSRNMIAEMVSLPSV